MWLTRNRVIQTLFWLILQAVSLTVSANICTTDPNYIQQEIGAGHTWSYYFAEEADSCQKYLCDVAEGPGIINPTLGTINWTPTTADQGVHAISVGHRLVIVLPLNGYTVLPLLVGKDVCLTVYPGNRPPVIDSRPLADSIGLRSAFAYTIRVTEPDGEPVSYSLLKGPSGMTLDAATGYLQWTPAISGDYPVRIQVEDPSGLSAQQSFTINVTSSDSALCSGIYPKTIARVGQPMNFEFNCLALGIGSCKLLSGPSGLTLTDESIVVPPYSTLLPSHYLHWTPSQAQTGKHIVTAQEVYNGAVHYTEDICVEVLANSIHDIVSLPPTNDIVAGDTFIYQVVADDRENDALTYELISGPAGLVINSSSGLLAGSLSTPGTYTVTVRATDNIGAVVQQTFSLNVAAPPPVIVPPSQNYRSGSVPSGADDMVYVHTDIGGSPLARTNAAGNLITRAKFSPYGEQLTAPGATDDKVAYAGHTFDDELGLSYMGARHYDPFVGRFMGVDPVGFDEGNIKSFNRFAYANNNPYKYIDPDGREALYGISLDMAAIQGRDVAALRAEQAQIGRAILGGIAVAGVSFYTANTLGPLAAEILFAGALGEYGLSVTKGIKTPYGVANQATDAASLAARGQVENGATLYRIGTTGKSQAAEAQFWSLENPLSKGFAQRYGIPEANIKNANFIETATLKPGTSFITRPAPGVGVNKGGGIEAVVPSSGVQMRAFNFGGP